MVVSPKSYIKILDVSSQDVLLRHQLFAMVVVLLLKVPIKDDFHTFGGKVSVF